MKNFKENKFMEFFNKNKKLLLIIGVAFVFVILIFIIITCLPSDKKDTRKMVKHLESVGYNCSFNEDEELYNCNRVNGIKKETVTIRYNSDIEYILESKNEYTMSISSDQYKKGFNGNGKYVVVTNLHNEEYSCNYFPISYNGESYKFSDNNYWKIGDTSIGYDADALDIGSDYDKCKYDFSDKVDKMLREFESYFSGAGLKLK